MAIINDNIHRIASGSKSVMLHLDPYYPRVPVYIIVELYQLSSRFDRRRLMIPIAYTRVLLYCFPRRDPIVMPRKRSTTRYRLTCPNGGATIAGNVLLKLLIIFIIIFFFDHNILVVVIAHAVWLQNISRVGSRSMDFCNNRGNTLTKLARWSGVRVQSIIHNHDNFAIIIIIIIIAERYVLYTILCSACAPPPIEGEIMRVRPGSVEDASAVGGTRELRIQSDRLYDWVRWCCNIVITRLFTLLYTDYFYCFWTLCDIIV